MAQYVHALYGLINVDDAPKFIANKNSTRPLCFICTPSFVEVFIYLQISLKYWIKLTKTFASDTY